MRFKSVLIAGLIIVLLIITYSTITYIRHIKFNKKMENNKNDETDNKTVGLFIGFDTTSFKANSKILYHHNNVMLIATDRAPYYLSISPEIDPTTIEGLKDNIASLQFVDFETNRDTSKLFYELPKWLSNEKHLNYLKLNSFKVGSFALLKSLPLKHLILSNILIENKIQILNDICKMKDLNYLVSNKLFNDSDIKFLQTKRPKLTILSLESYSKLIESKELKLW